MVNFTEYREINLSDLRIGTGQVRTRNIATDLPELVASIKQHGLLEPIVVCPGEESGQYEIITGQRRFLAHQELGLERIPAAILSERVDEITAKVLSVTENLIRKDLSSNDLIDVCNYLHRRYGTIKAVAEETALPYEKVRQYVRYERLIPELKKMVDKGQVDVSPALRAQDAASVTGDINQAEAIKFAIEMQEMSGAQQRQILRFRETDPSQSADELIEAAKTGGRITQVVVTLSSDIHTALRQYAGAQSVNLDDAAGMLIRNALFIEDYIKNP